MRRRKSFTHLLGRLSFEEKLIGAASLVTAIACFLPWYGISSRIMDQWWNGFSNIGYVVGYVVFLTALAVLYGITAPLFSLPTPKILARKFSYLVLHGESTFLLIILSFIYARYTIFDAPGSSVRFGLYTALIASFVGAISGYMLWKKHVADLRKKGLQEDFVQMPRTRNEYTEMEMEPEMNDEPVVNEQETLMAEEGIKEAEKVMAMEEEEPETIEEEIKDIDRDSTVEELTSSLQGEHQGLKTDEPELDSGADSELEEAEKEEDKVSFNF
jgi:hypothetical protein